MYLHTMPYCGVNLRGTCNLVNNSKIRTKLSKIMSYSYDGAFIIFCGRDKIQGRHHDFSGFSKG